MFNILKKGSFSGHLFRPRFGDDRKQAREYEQARSFFSLASDFFHLDIRQVRIILLSEVEASSCIRNQWKSINE